MKTDNFKIIERGFDKSRIADNGNRFLLGNGYMGIRGTLGEYTKNELAAVNLAGIYDKVGDGWREPLNAPNFLYSLFTADGEELNVLNNNPKDHEVVLDFYRGILSRKSVFDVGGKNVTYTSERFPDMEDPHYFYEKMTITADADTVIQVRTGIDCDIWDIYGPHFVRFEKESGEDGSITVTGFTAGDEKFVRVRTKTAGLTGPGIVTGADSILQTAECKLNGGENLVLYKIAEVFTSGDAADERESRISGRDAGVAGKGSGGNEREFSSFGSSHAGEIYERLKARHIDRWAERWENSGVTIAGDEEAEKAVNYSLYHLHSIAPRDKDSMSIAARGLSGQTYKGAVFWDTEMFILDFFLYTGPEVARTLIKYRIDTLDGALKKAKEYGYEGAFYAWESQEGGFDACSDYNVTDVFTKRPMRTYFRDKQVHISAAIVYGIKKYLDVTADRSILGEGAFEVIIECAKFYEDLLVKKVNQSRYEIHDVIGPDEYHERVNNNLYTNRMAKLVFDEAVRMIGYVLSGGENAETAEYPFEELKEKYDLESLRERFANASERIFIPGPSENGVIPQFDGYFALEDVSVEEVRGRLLDEREYWGGAYGVASHTQVIKQADVVTALALFKDEYDLRTLKANYDYYEPRTEHGSSLSACMYALLACYCGKPDDAYPFFMRSASADIRGGGKQWAGLVYIGGSHPASEGGAYMNVLYGFAGIDIKNGELSAKPQLPAGITKIEFKITFRGRKYLVSVERTKDGDKALITGL